MLKVVAIQDSLDRRPNTSTIMYARALYPHVLGLIVQRNEGDGDILHVRPAVQIDGRLAA